VNNVLSRSVSGLKTLFDPKIPHSEMPQINPRCYPLAPAAPHTPHPRVYAPKTTKHAHWWVAFLYMGKGILCVLTVFI